MTAREATAKAMRHRALIVDGEESMRLYLARIVVKPVERNALASTIKAQLAGRSRPKSTGK